MSSSTIAGTFTATGQGGGKPVRATITIDGKSREVNIESQSASDTKHTDPVAWAVYTQFTTSGTTSGTISVSVSS